MIPIEVAVRALQKLFQSFTGRELPAPKAKELIEHTQSEVAK